MIDFCNTNLLGVDEVHRSILHSAKRLDKMQIDFRDTKVFFRTKPGRHKRLDKMKIDFRATRVLFRRKMGRLKIALRASDMQTSFARYFCFAKSIC